MNDPKPEHLRHKILPLSFRGAVMAVASLVYLVQGILRADLAGIFWGSGFFLMALLSVVGNLIYMIILRSFAVKQRILADLKLASQGVFPGELSQAHHKIELPGFAVPGFSLLARIKLYWQGREPLVLKGPLAPGLNRYSLDFSVPHRGVYTSRFLEIDVFDFLGFSRSFLRIPLKESLRVYPERFEGSLDSRASEDEKNIEFNQNRVISDELLEVKKYYPGDDHRKLNWKIYAHTGELFVRRGEETPPPESNFCFVIFTGMSAFVKKKHQMDALDRLIGAVCRSIRDFQNQGYPVLLAVNDQSMALPFSANQSRDLLNYMAGIRSSEDPLCPEIPELNKKQLLVFTLPGTRQLGTFLETLKPAKSLSLFFKELPLFVDHSRYFDWKSIFINNASSKKLSWLEDKMSAEQYKFQLNREMILYQSQKGRIQLVKSF